MRSRSTASAPFTLEYKLTTSVVQARVTRPLSQLAALRACEGRNAAISAPAKGRRTTRVKVMVRKVSHASLGAAPARAVALPPEQRHDGPVKINRIRGTEEHPW